MLIQTLTLSLLRGFPQNLTLHYQRLSALKERRSKPISDWMGCKERMTKNKLPYSYRCRKGISDNTDIIFSGDGIYICFRSGYSEYGLIWKNGGTMEK